MFQRLIVLMVVCTLASAAYSQDYLGIVREIGQQNHCSFSSHPYGMQTVLGGKVSVFSGICGANAFVAARQASNPNDTWISKNCGPVTVAQPPPMPMGIPPQFISEEFKQYDAWLLQDSCNLWHPMPIPAEWQNAAAQKEKDKQARSDYWKAQTGCDVLSLSTTKFNGHSNEDVQLMCPGDVAKVGYADDNGPPQFYICQSPNDKVIFHSPNLAMWVAPNAGI